MQLNLSPPPWTSAALLSIKLLNLSELEIKIQNFSFIPKLHLKISFVKWRPFCPGQDELKCLYHYLLSNILSMHITLTKLSALTNVFGFDKMFVENVNKGVGWWHKMIMSYWYQAWDNTGITPGWWTSPRSRYTWWDKQVRYHAMGYHFSFYHNDKNV